MSGRNLESIEVRNPFIIVGRMTDAEYNALEKVDPDHQYCRDWRYIDDHWYSPKAVSRLPKNHVLRYMYKPSDFTYDICGTLICKPSWLGYDTSAFESFYEYELFYWFRCPNGQTIKIASTDIAFSLANECKDDDECVHYRRAVLTKYTPYARAFAHIDIEHILNHHYQDLFDLPHYGPHRKNYQNFRQKK